MAYGKKKSSKYTKYKTKRTTRTWKKKSYKAKGHSHLFTFSLDTSSVSVVGSTTAIYADHWHDAPPTGGGGAQPYRLPCPAWEAVT